MVSQIKIIDNEQDDLQYLGVLDIFKESLNIILSRPKIFTQITLAFILPHTCLFFANDWISKLLFGKLDINYTTSSKRFDSPTNDDISYSISFQWAASWLITMAYYIFSTILSLFTISSVVYTVACIYSGKDVTFKKVISVVPRVWKRLMVTFLCNLCIMFAYVYVLILVIIVYIAIYYVLFFKTGNMKAGSITTIPLVCILLVLSMVAFFYMAMIWQLANVISVMEENCGFKALKKSKSLIKGKMGTSLAILLVMSICSTPTILMNQKLARIGVVERICYGIPSLMLSTLLTLFGLVVQTTFYLVCKSYHHESIDKTLLADHLDAYLGYYVPLKNEDAIQLEHQHV